jgi:hypothetical protein
LPVRGLHIALQVQDIAQVGPRGVGSLPRHLKCPRPCPAFRTGRRSLPPCSRSGRPSCRLFSCDWAAARAGHWASRNFVISLR